MDPDLLGLPGVLVPSCAAGALGWSVAPYQDDGTHALPLSDSATTGCACEGFPAKSRQNETVGSGGDTAACFLRPAGTVLTPP